MNQRTYVFSQSVNFVDIDMGGGLYHGRYLDYYDRARQQMLADLGAPIGQMIKSGQAFVVVDAEIKFLRPVYLEDTLFVYSRVVSSSNKSVTIEQVMTNTAVGSDDMGKPLSEFPQQINRTKVVLVAVDLREKRSIAIPDFIKQAVDEAV